jgi:hypothetical protein
MLGILRKNVRIAEKSCRSSLRHTTVFQFIRVFFHEIHTQWLIRLHASLKHIIQQIDYVRKRVPTLKRQEFLSGLQHGRIDPRDDDVIPKNSG